MEQTQQLSFSKYPPYLKGDKERISMSRVKDSPLKIRGARGVMKMRALI
jgi:hypothetical protein